MKVKWCGNCGYQLYRKSLKCPWCKTPVKKTNNLRYILSALIAFPVFFLLLALFSKNDSADIPPSKEPIHSSAVKAVSLQLPINYSKENPTKVYVKGKIVNLRQHSNLKSPILKKLKRGQQLTSVGRSGNWVHVVMDKKESKRGWIHASMVEKFRSDPSSISITQHQAYKAFRIYFKRFNAKIKKQKGITFFKNVEYLDNGVIQVTATRIFLSAPERYKQKYLRNITQKWVALREPNLRAAVRVVDAEGYLRMEKKRG